MAANTPKPAYHQAECLINAGLQAQVLLPTEADYIAREESYWSNSAKLKPACIVRPRSSQEVAVAVKALVAAGQKFAVRSGGHTQWAGSNNIQDGVTIDMSLLDSTIFDSASETVSIGPGARWRHVYDELHKHGRAVAGGRDGNVGVAGLLLGGGLTFFSARMGFACDNVIEYEIVLADGSITYADKERNGDLFVALKGGSNNFGIVTSFKMNAIKSDKIWGGVAILPKQATPQAVDAFVAFTDNVTNDNDSSLICFFTHSPRLKDIVITPFYANIAGIEKPPAYDKWLSLPEIDNKAKMTSISEMASEYHISAGYYDTCATCCFKSDACIVARAVELHTQLVQELADYIPDRDFITQCVFQPLPTIFGQRSVEAGGRNVLGVERQPHNGIIFSLVVMVRTPEQEAFAYPKVIALVNAVVDYAATEIEGGGNLDWIYLNYADKSQDPLSTYGASNLKLMREVAVKYDPNQVFQKLCPGGFKISDVKS